MTDITTNLTFFANKLENNMYKLVFIVGLFAIGLLSYSCNDQNINGLEMGEDYIKDESGIVLIDTLSLEISTIIIDSVETSEPSSTMVGEYYHEYFGNIATESVFRVTLPDVIDFDEDDVFDSITICMNYSGYYLGDTTRLHSIVVNELETDLEELDQTIFYNTSRVKVKDEILGEMSYYPYPNKGETLEKRLNNIFGEELFGLFVDDAEEVSSLSLFQDYLKGFVLRGRASVNQSIIGFAATDTSIYLKMYYHRIEGEKKELEAILGMENSSYSFNTVHTDRSETPLQSLRVQREAVVSRETGNTSLVQGGSAIMTKVRFPGLAEVFQLVEINQIIKAELILVPTRESEDINSLPSQLVVYESDKINRLVTPLTSDASETLTFQLYSAVDNFESKPYYSIDITDYIIANLLGGFFDPDNALLVGLPDNYMQETVYTVIFGGELNTDYTPKLKLYTYFY